MKTFIIRIWTHQITLGWFTKSVLQSHPRAYRLGGIVHEWQKVKKIFHHFKDQAISYSLLVFIFFCKSRGWDLGRLILQEYCLNWLNSNKQSPD